eukprot:4461725-Pyramimonas_sp.AAC.1
MAQKGTPPEAPAAVCRCVSPNQHTLRGPMGSSTEGPSGGVHMRLPHPARRFVAPWGAPPNACPPT